MRSTNANNDVNEIIFLKFTAAISFYPAENIQPGMGGTASLRQPSVFGNGIGLKLEEFGNVLPNVNPSLGYSYIERISLFTRANRSSDTPAVSVDNPS
jgi:hypothetical protein